MGWGYTPNYPGIRRYLKTSPDLKKELYRRAVIGLRIAQGLAPKGETGDLARSGEIRDDGPRGGVDGNRMQFSIHFTSEHAVAATFPRGDRDARNYLLAALAAMERGR